MAGPGVSACPWYITAHAVRRWLEITRRPAGEAHFEDARIELVALAADTWARYEQAHREPRITRTGAYQYRSAYTQIGRSRTKVDLIVSMEVRPEGPKPQLVDVHWGGERR